MDIQLYKKLLLLCSVTLLLFLICLCNTGDLSASEQKRNCPDLRFLKEAQSLRSGGRKMIEYRAGGKPELPDQMWLQWAGWKGRRGPTFNIILTILNSATYLKIFCMQQLDMYHFLAVHCAAGSDHFVDLQCLACDRDRDCDALFCCSGKGLRVCAVCRAQGCLSGKIKDIFPTVQSSSQTCPHSSTQMHWC